jgi:hypothetical protein
VTVDLSWKDGKLVAARLTPDRDGPLRVRVGDAVHEFAGKAGHVTNVPG